LKKGKKDCVEYLSPNDEIYEWQKAHVLIYNIALSFLFTMFRMADFRQEKFANRRSQNIKISLNLQKYLSQN